ncbi:hypothetical protein K438DRAFT_2101925 [Mycena galopus ATCC 62051]|nr:hypothetical protein K438DRAFT_2101925 [Mycena galopus ATCC 62051]
MPRLPTATEIRLDNITTCLTQALLLLTELHDAFGPPFVQSIVNTVGTLIGLVQNVKRNKSKCAQVMEHIHQILYTIITLHIKSETVGSLPPSMLDNIGKFMKTLHKIYIFIEAQQEANHIKYLFHANEMSKLLHECHAGLNQAMEVFGIQTGMVALNDVREFKNRIELTQRELIKAIEATSDTGTLSSERSSIFHGREQELEIVLKLLSQKSPRIAILGGGGMGKTSLARAALHHPDTTSKFEHRFFVSAEAASTSIELAALVGFHLGLNPGQDLTKAVVQHFARKPSALLILDNLETVWEPIQARAGVENFLSLLSEVEHVALIITMRGAERPARVQWTHPFLLPLQPLSDAAAKQTFMDITDNAHTMEEINQLLHFTNNMPLAVELIAHLTDYEGMSSVLSRWETEKTSMLSAGLDRRSSLDASINLSLSSPRITSDSKELLSLLSILPNGLSEVELVQAHLGIPKILTCKAALQATSLVHQDSNGQLVLLMPVREYVQHFMPPTWFHIQAICRHFCDLLKLYKDYHTEQQHSPVNQIAMNLANLHEVLKRGLHDGDSNLADIIYGVLSLNVFHRVTGRKSTPLMNDIPSPLPSSCDDKLGVNLFIELLQSVPSPKAVSEQAITQVISWFDYIHDPVLESRFYNSAGTYMHFRGNDHQATKFMQKALELARLCDDSYEQCKVLLNIGWAELEVGDYCAAQKNASAAQGLSKLCGNIYNEARANDLGASCAIFRGDYQDGVAQLHRARDLIFLYGLSGGGIDYAITLHQAEMYLSKSEYSQARNLFSAVAETTSPKENARSHAYALLNIAVIDIAIDGPKEYIYHNFDIARAIWSETTMEISLCDMLQGRIELLEGRFDSAKVKFQECLTSTRGYHDTRSFCFEQLANIQAWPENEWQYKWPITYLGYAHILKHKLALHKALLFLGDVFISNEDEETATSLYQVALEGFTYMDVHQSRAQCMLRLGDLANKNGRTSEAITFWKAAQPLFERSSQAKDMAQIDAKIATVENAGQMALAQLETLDAPVQVVNEDINKDSVREGAKEHPVPVLV